MPLYADPANSCRARCVSRGAQVKIRQCALFLLILVHFSLSLTLCPSLSCALSLLICDPLTCVHTHTHMQVRLPPMNLNKEAADPKLLAAGLGNLFCMPCEL